MRWWLPYLCLFALTFLVAFLVTPLARRCALALDAVDYPSARRINKKPIPRMGGIAIMAALVAGVIAQILGTHHMGWPTVFLPSSPVSLNYVRIGLAFIVIFATGAIDDVIQLRPLAKLAGQVVAAILAVSGGLAIGNIVNPFADGVVDLGMWAAPVSVLYLVAYVNIINLIDGLDGLATGISCIAAATMFALSVMAGRLDAAILSVALTGATLGFLPYNFNPASIFLGDCGSLLLGFGLGVVSMLTVRRIAGLTTIIVPLVVALIPIMDTFSAIVRRKRAHVSVGQADRGHIHHRLIAEGFDQRQAVLLIYAWTGLLCVGSLVMTQVAVWPRAFIFGVLVAASLGFARHLHLFEPVLRHHYDPVTGEDQLVTPDDPAFAIEEERAEEEREERHEEISEILHHHHHER